MATKWLLLCAAMVLAAGWLVALGTAEHYTGMNVRTGGVCDVVSHPCSLPPPGPREPIFYEYDSPNWAKGLAVSIGVTLLFVAGHAVMRVRSGEASRDRRKMRPLPERWRSTPGS